MRRDPGELTHGEEEWVKEQQQEEAPDRLIGITGREQWYRSFLRVWCFSGRELMASGRGSIDSRSWRGRSFHDTCTRYSMQCGQETVS